MEEILYSALLSFVFLFLFLSLLLLCFLLPGVEICFSVFAFLFVPML